MNCYVSVFFLLFIFTNNFNFLNNYFCYKNCFYLTIFVIDVVSEYFKKNPTVPQEQIGLPPVGYENKARNEVSQVICLRISDYLLI